MNQLGLFKNYLKLGLRNIRRNALISSINIFGLAIALGFGITTFIFVDLVSNMDHYHSKGDRLYQLTNYVNSENDQRLWGDTPILLGPKIAEDHPAVEAFTRVEYIGASVKMGANVFDELVVFVDNDFFSMFDFPVEIGEENALESKDKIVISSEMATKYFGYDEAVGKDLTLKFNNGKVKRFIVGSVLKEYPYNSGFNYGFLISMENFKDLRDDPIEWDYMTDATFVLLKEGETFDNIKASYGDYVKLQNGSNPEWEVLEYQEIPFFDLQSLGNEIYSGVVPSSNITGRIALTIIGLMLIAMACFNFMNISVTGATKRLREIGLRKVMGGIRKQLITQFLVENILQCFFALAVGTLLAYFLLVPGFDALIPPLNIEFRAFQAESMVTFYVLLLLGIGLLSGAYPALYVSKFSPIAILRGNQKLGGKNFLTRFLLGVQFFLAFYTIIGSLVFTDNSINMANRDWGYNPENSFYVYVKNNENFERMKASVEENPDVLQFAGATGHIGTFNPKQSFEHLDQQIAVRNFGVSENYFELLGLRLKEGRFLTGNIEDQQSAVVVNETFLDQLNWDDPINKVIDYNGARRKIVGVVEDFHYLDFYGNIEPVIFSGLDTSSVNFLVVKTLKDRLFTVDDKMRQAWLGIAPNEPYERGFQEDIFDDFYQENNANVTIMIVICIIAVILASLGLYGLLSFNIQSKLKEFSVRKVLGASPKSITKIASKQYTWVLIISFVLGAPAGAVGILMMMNSIYPDPKPLSAPPFVFAFLVIIGTLVLTVAGQIRKAIKVNPAAILRNE